MILTRRSLLSSISALALYASLGASVAQIGGTSGISSASGGGGGSNAPVIATTGGLVMNLAATSYFGGDCPFLNLLKTAGNYGINCQQTCAFTNGSANVGYVSHKASVGTFVNLSNSGGALPTNFSSATQYYVHQIIDANTVTLTTTAGGGGSAVVAGSAGTGTQTMALGFGGADAWATGYLDGNGNLIAPLPAQVKGVQFNIFTPPPSSSVVVGWESYFNQVLNITWTGGAGTAVQPSFSFYGSGGSIVSGANSATITLGSSGTIQNVGFTLNITDPTNPPQNLYVSLPKYAANVAAGQFWNPDFIASLKFCGVLRFMDWMNTNTNSTTTTGLSTLCDANYFYCNGGWSGSGGPKGGIHPSLVVSLAKLTGCNVLYNIPVAITDANMLAIALYFAANMPSNLFVIYEFGNENWNFGVANGPFSYCNGQVYPGTGTTGNPWQFSGYRAAQLWQIIYNAYGAGARSRWRGALGSQFVDTAVTSAVIQGVQFYVANGATNTFNQLCDTVLVAPYFGDFQGGIPISSITPGNPTIINTTSTLPSNYITNYVARLFVPGGTGSAALNNQSFTITKTAASQFTVPVDTTGDTFTGTLYAADGNLFTIFDTSLSNFNSNPSTYPTKYTYAANQLATSFATGTCSGGFVTSANGSYTGNGNLTGGMGLLMAQQALIANENGLTLTGYEGGNNFGTVEANLSANTQFVDYYLNCINEPGTISLPGYSLAYAAEFNAWNLVNSAYPAQYTGGGQPGIWFSRRGFSDTTSGTWKALIAESALGPWVDPTPPAPGTYAGPATVGSYYTGGAPSGSASFSAAIGTAATYVVVGIFSQNTPTLTGSITVGGVALTLDAGAATPGSLALYSGAVPAGSATRTVIIPWTGNGFLVQGAYVWAATNLGTNAAASSNSVGSGGTLTLAETKGALILVVGNSTTAGVTYNGSSVIPTAQGASPAFGSYAWWGPAYGNSPAIPLFTSSIFRPQPSAGTGLVAATYR